MKDFREYSMKDQVSIAETEIQAMSNHIMGYIDDNDIDHQVALACLIAIIARGVAGEAKKDVTTQDEMIEFVAKGLRVSLAENGYREFTQDMSDAIPPWEKN